MTKTNNVSRVLSLVLALVMVLGVVMPASAVSFNEEPLNENSFSFTVVETTRDPQTRVISDRDAKVFIQEYNLDDSRTGKAEVAATYDSASQKWKIENPENYLTAPDSHSTGYKYRVVARDFEGRELGTPQNLLRIQEVGGSNVFYEPSNTLFTLNGHENDLGTINVGTNLIRRVASITVTPATKTIKSPDFDQTVEYTATVEPEDARQDVEWDATGSPAHAGIKADANGVVTVPTDYVGTISVTATTRGTDYTVQTIFDTATLTVEERDALPEPNSSLQFINMADSVEFDKDQIKDMFENGRIRLVLEKADGSTEEDGIRKIEEIPLSYNDRKGELEFYLNKDKIKAGDRLVVRYWPQGRQVKADNYSAKVIYPFTADKEAKPGGVYRFESDFEYNQGKNYIQVTSDGTPLVGVQFEIQVLDKDGDPVVFSDRAGVNKLTPARRTNSHGYYLYSDLFKHDGEGKSVQDLLDANETGGSYSGELYLLDENGSRVHRLEPGQSVRFRPTKTSVETNNEAVLNVKYNKDNVFIFTPEFQVFDRDTSDGEVLNFKVKKPDFKNVRIDYGKKMKTVRIRAFSEGTPGRQEPVVGSTFSVYLADRDERLSMKPGKQVYTGKTDEKGYLEFELPIEYKESVFNTAGDNLAYRYIDIPYLIVQEDGGVDETVRPIEGYINAAGYYDENGVRNRSDIASISAIPSNDDDEYVISVQVRNIRDAAPVARVEDENVIKNAVEVARTMYPEGADEVIIATVEEGKLADALTAGSLAGALDAPLLLVEKDSIPADVKEYLSNPNTKPGKITVVGGKDTISDAVVTELEAIAGSVQRVSGANRWETATEAAKRIQKLTGTDKVLLANGEGNEKFIDALTASAVAAQYKYPVVLTAGDNLPKESADFLSSFDVNTVYVIGGENSVSENVVRAVNNLLKSGTTVERVAGETRFETAVAVAKKFFPEAKNAVFVDGENNALALVSGPLAAKLDGPVILVGKDVPASVDAYLKEANIKGGYLVGNTDSTSEEVRKAINAITSANIQGIEVGEDVDKVDVAN